MVATLTLSAEDPRVWGPQPPIAGYVHRLAVGRRFAGFGLGAEIFQWAAARVHEWGRAKLRLDCLETNASLVAYYRRIGFREAGRTRGHIPGESRCSILWERDVG
ncbi:MAG TPA: GNAT family N-acetyltransferase [Thermoplasmata archaeon]|nr:GNAT family N-acetyltransferase [Thermoplasmata archaeon]